MVASSIWDRRVSGSCPVRFCTRVVVRSAEVVGTSSSVGVGGTGGGLERTRSWMGRAKEGLGLGGTRVTDVGEEGWDGRWGSEVVVMVS